jgi:HAD superfamily hydrolase (TIGR01490 family)
MTPSATSRPAALFDLDGTIVTVATLFSFATHYWTATGRAEVYTRMRRRIDAQHRAGADRTETLRTYFDAFAGETVEAVSSAGWNWFAQEALRPGLFHPLVLQAWRRHARAGHLIGIVSGSFAPCVAPIAHFLGADVLIVSEPTIVDGRFTGGCADPMIGPAKACAVRELFARRGVAAADAHAYGDHASDLDLLALVGHPVVVGEDPTLVDHAARCGWRGLPAAGALPVGALPVGAPSAGATVVGSTDGHVDGTQIAVGAR